MQPAPSAVHTRPNCVQSMQSSVQCSSSVQEVQALCWHQRPSPQLSSVQAQIPSAQTGWSSGQSSQPLTSGVVPASPALASMGVEVSSGIDPTSVVPPPVSTRGKYTPESTKSPLPSDDPLSQATNKNSPVRARPKTTWRMALPLR